MIFRDRIDAGRRLAGSLRVPFDPVNTVVLGIPRGGVIVASEIARALRLPLDIFLSHKLGVPGHEELAFGALTASGECFLDSQLVRSQGISSEQVDQITLSTAQQLQTRAALFRAGKLPLELRGRTAILVDDGIATGASIYVAVKAMRQMGPAKIVVAVPVAPRSVCAWLPTIADDLVCLECPESFYAVGQFYEDFAQTSDEEVIAALRL